MKRCPLCGKEYEQETMCPSCGVVLIDTTTNSAVASEPDKKTLLGRKNTSVQKDNAYSSGSRRNSSSGMKPFYIVAIVIALVVVIIAAVFMVKSMNAKKAAEETYQYQMQDEASSEQEVGDDTNVPDEMEIEEETTAEEAAAPAVSMENVQEVVTSSVLSDDYGTYKGEYAVDGNSKTAWVEGVSGFGPNESITLYLDGTYLVSGFKIQAGYQKSENVYYKNTRPGQLYLVFSDGSSEEIMLDDIYGSEQYFELSEPRETTSVQFVLENRFYEGSKYQDTCISEISLY